MTVEWRCLSPGCYVSRDGLWSVTKEHYADGPTLFDWILRGPGTYESFPRLKDATKEADSLDARPYACLDCGRPYETEDQIDDHIQESGPEGHPSYWGA